MKGLFILFNYYPENSANAIQNHRFIEGLKSVGIIPTIVTQENGGDPRIIDIHGFNSNNLNYIARHTIPQIALMPDLEKFTWVNKVKRKIEKLVNISEFDFVHTNGIPNSTHEIGVFLKKKYGIPWIAHFYEAWTDNYYKDFKYSLVKKLNFKQELNVIKHADLIIHTNDFLKDVWIKNHGNMIDKKIEILPLCTDECINTTSANQIQNKRFVITHAGGLYGDRNLDFVIDSLIMLNKKNTHVKDLLEIKIIGVIPPNNKKRILEEGLQEIFYYYGRMPYQFVKESLNSSDALLVIDSLKPDNNLFFPSKICEYFSYNKPIIGITSKRSVVRNYLTQSGHFVAGENEQELLSNYLEELLYENRPKNYDLLFYKNFLPSKIAKSYQLYLNKILYNSNG